MIINSCKNFKTFLKQLKNKVFEKYSTGNEFITRKFMKFFSSYHEGRQVSSVYGKEHYSEHGPNISHEPGGEPSGTVHVHSRLEQHCPHQPVGAKQTEPATIINLQVFHIYSEDRLWCNGQGVWLSYKLLSKI